MMKENDKGNGTPDALEKLIDYASRTQLTPPDSLRQKLMDLVDNDWETIDEGNAVLEEEVFMPLAAAEKSESHKSRMVSSSGGLQINTIPDNKKPGYSYVTVQFLDDAYTSWQGQNIQISYGDVIVFKGILTKKKLIIRNSFPRETFEGPCRIGPVQSPEEG